jgi:hypothetical protein
LLPCNFYTKNKLERIQVLRLEKERDKCLNLSITRIKRKSNERKGNPIEKSITNWREKEDEWKIFNWLAFKTHFIIG